MSWHPNDLLSDADLLAYERTVLQQFAVTDWTAKRAKTLEDWLRPQMVAHGFNPDRLRTRFVADAVFANTSSTFSDVTDAAENATADDINLATILASSSDYLAIGSTQQFRGLSIRMLDAVNTVAGTLTVEVWCDEWRAVTVTDTTQATIGKPFSRGGSLSWVVPSEWVLRTLNSSDPYYWARIKLSAAPTGAKFGQVSCIRRSVFTAPAALRTLAMVFFEAPVSHKSPWLEKARFYEREADASLNRAWALAGGEFELSDPIGDAVTQDDAANTSDQAGSPLRWERS